MLRLFLLALLWAVNPPALAADHLRPQLLLTASSSRAQNLDLSGRWTYSKDLYRTGLTDINGWVAKSRMQRHRDVDIAAAEAQAGTAFFEFDLDRGPTMQVPGAWNSAEPELRYYDGLIWFQRRFDAPKAATGQRSFLRFEAVNYRAFVYLNGQEVGRHEGGFTPFVIEVTGTLRDQGNRLVVGVDSRHDGQSIPGEITDWDLYGGITRPVRLIQTPATFIDDATLQLTKEQRLVGSIQLNGPRAAGQAVKLSIAALGLKLEARTDAQGLARFETMAPAALKRWTPESPTLYEVEFASGDDRVVDRIGLRTIEVQGSQILLNGQPIFLRGVSLHEEELSANPARRLDDAAARALLQQVKQGLGGNYVRLSHYPHAETLLRAADELGLLVWSEIPVYWTVDWDNKAVLDKARSMQAETIYRDRNRAALVLWSVGNETPVAENRTRFHAALAATVRALDPSRLISAALLVERKGQVLEIADPLLPHLDVVAVNTYAGWYGDDKLEDLAKLQWKLPADKPLLASEFGADALAGVHDASPKPRKWSEEFQAAYYRATLAMLDKLPTLTGLSPWVLKDFRSPRREHPVYQNGWNRKGLLSETGQKKLAFEVMAAYYRLQARRFDVAITVDDLPVHGALPPGVSRLQVAEAHLQAFREAGVTEAWGFVNSRGAEQEGDAALAAWRRAGQPLGNHSYSHMNLGRAASLEAWQEDVVAGEPLIARLMAGSDWRWFRYPYLAVGDGERREAARTWLLERGYRIADVSLSFSDWDYSDAYARCKAVGNEAAVAAMTAHYLRGVDAGIAQALTDSEAVYGRRLPLVLLTHMGAFSAVTLPEVLRRLQAAGARFVPLAQAQADPAYQRFGGGGLIAREAKARGLALPSQSADPTPLEPKSLCR
ncbi:glycoside hydrolase family 2 TIM barrel-domain containing protein [Pelomonas sp. SE-A7]|uniref:glycoside hydrolase family 2 TIM barrel-domain containing protein n=1 Tax=Pelomonas sp. SE-A7 TaxID=3054953 RepID=UPI00259CD34B|nr:glycoside hydrolase family 2 TIM barrel-domain containing protein [Pelomonas sp. SE-A7]MDM4765252.1 glycoside hydrolase family 2 TIM barrel-domain containing protein [Pelomonas sp. SE-A7]